MDTPWQPPSLNHKRQIWSGLPLTAQSLAISRCAQQPKAWTIVVAASSLQAQQLLDEITYFVNDTTYPIWLFPDWETLAYDAFSPHEDIISNRLKILSQLQHLDRGILIVPIATLLQRLAPKQYVSARTFCLETGQLLDLSAFTRQLQQAGYHAVSQVYTHGEYACRGSIIDLFPMGSHTPFRIDLLDTEIDSIRTFDSDSQLSVEKVSAIDILPAREFALDEESLQQFRLNWRKQFNGDPMQSPFYKSIQNGIIPNGAEYYLPLFHSHTDSLFAYLPSQCYFFLPENYAALSKSCTQEWQDRYERRNLDRSRPLLPPAQLFINSDEFKSILEGLKNRTCLLSDKPLENSVCFELTTAPPLSIQPQKTMPLIDINDYLTQSAQRVLICAHSVGRLQFNRDFFAKYGIDLPTMNSIEAFLKSTVPIAIVLAPLYDNFNCPPLKITLISEASLWGQKITERKKPRKDKRYSDDFANLAELSLGAPVVHLDHGIGRYEGLVVLDAGGQKGEYLLLSYENNDKLYVPVSSLHLISRYSGVNVDTAPLSHLGSAQWQKAKDKALAKARDTAAELLALYAKRSALTGHHFHIDELEYQQFCQGFAFEETFDQQQAIDA
ncbi:MAG: transcription-repair coupling factor, partial [Gammaproteobacteria bacterium]|nr:transcription-repair coupling factor [Gammaproteobacteria bacterium]